MAIPKFIAKIAAKKLMRKAPEYISKLANTPAAVFTETRPEYKQGDEENMPQQSSNPNNLSNVQRSDIYKTMPSDAKGPFYKMSKEAFGKLSVEAGQDNNPGITQADFVVNAERKGLTRSSLTMMSDLKKHCYNSKKKK